MIQFLGFVDLVFVISFKFKSIFFPYSRFFTFSFFIIFKSSLSFFNSCNISFSHDFLIFPFVKKRLKFFISKTSNKKKIENIVKPKHTRCKGKSLKFYAFLIPIFVCATRLLYLFYVKNSVALCKGKRIIVSSTWISRNHIYPRFFL